MENCAMTASRPTIRPAGIADAENIAVVHVDSWVETYKGLLPDTVISRRNVSERAKAWATLLSDTSGPDKGCVYLAEIHDQICGFVCAVPQRDEALQAQGFSAEVAAIYVLQSTQRTGLGRALMRKAAGHLASQGHKAASLWVLDTNAPARSFYEALGGIPVGTREEVRPEVTLREVAYGWADLQRLAR